jgi:hypothetical protein
LPRNRAPPFAIGVGGNGSSSAEAATQRGIRTAL